VVAVSALCSGQFDWTDFAEDIGKRIVGIKDPRLRTQD
jgi:hypothetical protein